MKTCFWQPVKVMVQWRNARHYVSVSGDSKLLDFKRAIEDVIFLGPDHQELVHQGRQLSGDDLPISSFGICSLIIVYRKIHVIVSYGDHHLHISANNCTTVRQLKRKALDTFNLALSEHYFLKEEGSQGDVVLDNNLTLEDADIHNDSVLNLVFREI